MTAHLRIVAVALVFLVSTTAAIPAVIGIPGGPGVSIGPNGVSAYFGGYRASAGLGGGATRAGKAGGGLFANAGTPDGAVAAAGLGGDADINGKAAGGLYSGAGLGGRFTATRFIGGRVGGGEGGVVYKQDAPKLFENIFSIPTDMLKDVNQLFNNRQGK